MDDEMDLFEGPTQRDDPVEVEDSDGLEPLPPTTPTGARRGGPAPGRAASVSGDSPKTDSPDVRPLSERLQALSPAYKGRSERPAVSPPARFEAEPARPPTIACRRCPRNGGARNDSIAGVSLEENVAFPIRGAAMSRSFRRRRVAHEGDRHAFA
jgi:hypothetical protein